MIDRSKTKKILAGLVGLMLGAFAWAAPADAQWGRMHGGWGYGYHHRPIVRHYPARYRRVVVVRHPRYGRRVHHPVYWRRPPWVERPWHHRRRCFLPERYLCR